MDKKIIKFDDIEIQEYEFHQYKCPVPTNNIFPFDKQDFKYFIDYKDNKGIRPLGIFFPEMSIYKRNFDKTKCMYFSTKHEKVLNI